MKNQGLMHGELSKIIAAIGHGQSIVIADCGLPIPESIRLVDLALMQGIPKVTDVLRVLLDELVIESITIAQELLEQNSDFFLKDVENLLGNNSAFLLTQMNKVSHEEFKQLVPQAYVVIRTGEWTPYSNLLLIAGVPF